MDIFPLKVLDGRVRDNFAVVVMLYALDTDIAQIILVYFTRHT